MASAFFEIMGVNYALPVAECDLNITSKQQYGIISGIWFAGEKSCDDKRSSILRRFSQLVKKFLHRVLYHNLQINVSFVLSGIIISSHLWGFLSDTYGRQKILRIASLSAFAFSVCSSLAGNLWQLALFRLLNGLW